jgi:5-methylthioadenosine/S-adenosylhomocysteine deaminase
MMTIDLLFKNATIITMDEERRILKNAAIAIGGNRILAIGNSAELLVEYHAERIVDCCGKVLMPGLIDCHGHSGHGLLRTLGTDTSDGWPEACETIYTSGSTEEFWQVDAYLMALERLKFGVTSGMTLFGGGGAVLTGDMVIRVDSPIYGEQHCRAVQAVGSREFLAVGPRRSPFPHRYVHRSQSGDKEISVGLEEYYQTCEKLIADWHGQANGKIQMAITTQTYHPSLAEPGSKRHDELAAETRLFYELAERHDLLFTQDGHTTGTIDFARRELGILGSKTLFSHCTDLTEADIAACAETDTHIIHNPSAIASVTGRCPVPELMDAGVNVVIASDGLGPDRSCDLFRHIFYSMRYHRHHFRDPSYLPPGKALEMITIDAAKALGVDEELGSLEVGKKADLILIDTQKPHLTPMLMPVHQIANFANGNDVQMVVVDGDILVEDGKVNSVDEPEILARVQRVAEETIDYNNLHSLLVPNKKLWGHSKT